MMLPPKRMTMAQVRESQVALFVKYPEPGRVKTRLAQSVGFVKAAEMYARLAEQNAGILKSAINLELGGTVAFDPPEAEEKIKSWISGDFHYLAQRGGSLGDRLLNAFSDLFNCGAAKTLALGSDTVGLKPEDLSEASARLAICDLVLGPARDGGYYLIGVKRHRPELFSAISWSTEHVLEQTLERAKKNALSWFMLRELDDLDAIPAPAAPVQPTGTALPNSQPPTYAV